MADKLSNSLSDAIAKLGNIEIVKTGMVSNSSQTVDFTSFSELSLFLIIGSNGQLFSTASRWYTALSIGNVTTPSGVTLSVNGFVLTITASSGNTVFYSVVRIK